MVAPRAIEPQRNGASGSAPAPARTDPTDRQVKSSTPPAPVSGPTAAQTPSPALAISDAERVQLGGGKIRLLP
jgi:hypothetical protein